MRDEGKWLPIESAPKDAQILLYSAPGPLEIGWWNQELGGPGWITSAGYNQHDYWNYVNLISPTHWMPLPSPPQESDT
jgi:hypothetical protein